MKLSGITEKKVKDISVKELLSLHRRVHQLYSLASKKEGVKLNKQFMRFLVRIHFTLSQEMISRGIKHNTPLKKGGI